MNHPLMVISACPNEEEANRIARELVELRLAACVQIIPAIRSIYRWREKVESASECLLLVKTNSAKFELLRQRIELLHSYEVPEIIALPVNAGAEKYLAWMEDALHA